MDILAAFLRSRPAILMVHADRLGAAFWKRRMVDNSAPPSSVPASPPGYRSSTIIPLIYKIFHLSSGKVTLQFNKGCYAKLGVVNHAFPGKRGLSDGTK